MTIEIGKKYEIIGKVDSINQGANFSNTTVIIESKEHINIKLDKNQLSILEVGKIYLFEVEGANRRDEDLVLKGLTIKAIEEVLKGEELGELYEKFYTYAPVKLKEIKNQIEAYLGKIKNKVILDITKKIYDDNKDKFYIHPAATKFHHAYIGGLSYHTLTMLRLVEPYVDIYEFLDKDLLIAGVILHDMGKLREITGVDGEYTKEGLLIGHLVMGTIDIDETAKSLGYENKEEVLLLKHMILAHHGQLNYGSPKKPQIGEALLLWYIDTIDSKLTVLGEELDSIEEGQFTSMITVLDKMKFYKKISK